MVFPVFSYLGQEMLARFYGPNRRLWYLTDGGHFENSGAFELLRRRLPIIILSDCGQDPHYTFTDLSNLTLKARIDLSAEIRTFTRAELNWFFSMRADLKDLRDSFGTKEDFSEPKEGKRPHALLAWVFYDGAHVSNPESEAARKRAGSIMVIVKPALSGDEPMDLQHFSRQFADFPQQSTGDQFFDEAQWESYRKLGEHVGLQLFATNIDDYTLTYSLHGSIE